MSTLRADNRMVKKVRVVVHTQGVWPNSTMSENHWSIFLVFAGEESVRMNMTADYGNPTGRLEWRSLLYTVSESTVKSWDYQAVSGVSVGQVYQLVMGNGRDKYEMSGGGSGCRYWV